MKKIYCKIIIIAIFALALIFINQSECNAANANISASGQNVNVGDKVNINVSINATAWNVKVNGSGISDSIVGGNLEDIKNVATNKTYSLSTSNPGTYTVSISGDVTDENGTNIPVSGSVNVTVKEKETTPKDPTPEPTPEPPKQQEPTFAARNETVYAINEINVRQSYSTASKVVGSLKKGQSVTRIGLGSNGWSKVTYNGQTAYISSSLLTTTKPEEPDENEDEEESNEKSTNKTLKDLVIENYKLTPDFNPETRNYTIEVGNDVEKLEISPILEDEKAKYEITGNENFKRGNNIVRITVTAEDGTTRVYTITVTKTNEDESEDSLEDMLKLSKLKVNGVNLEPEFDPDITNYVISVSDPSSIDVKDIIATAEDKDVKVTIAEADENSSEERVITIMLENSDATKTGVYQITIKKVLMTPIASVQSNKDNSIYYILGGIIGVLLIAIIAIIIVLKKTSNKEDDEYYEDADELSDNYNYSLKNETDEAVEDNDVEYDEMVENSSVKSQILNQNEYNVFQDIDNNIGRDEDIIDEEDLKRKKKGKHF